MDNREHVPPLGEEGPESWETYIESLPNYERLLARLFRPGGIICDPAGVEHYTIGLRTAPAARLVSGVVVSKYDPFREYDRAVSNQVVLCLICVLHGRFHVVEADEADAAAGKPH